MFQALFMIRSFLLLVVSFFCLASSAQKKDLYLKRSDNGFYLEHKVVAKENFFSVGRLYNVHPRHLASFNKLDYNKGLFLDKTIRIPLSDTNFSQRSNKGTPVYYRAGEKDDWSSIAKAWKVSTDKLKVWNEGPVKSGQKIVVGLLLSPEFASMTFSGKAEKEMVKEEEKKEKEELKEEKKTSAVTEKLPEEKQPEKEVEGKPTTEEKKQPDNNYQPGYFFTSFEQQVKKEPAIKEETLTSGIFKTSSGWQDGKYYLLMDGVSAGTIVRLTNPSNNRVIYAKVLGEMSGIRLNDGFNIRISNAAAASLGISEEDKFILKVNY